MVRLRKQVVWPCGLCIGLPRGLYASRAFVVVYYYYYVCVIFCLFCSSSWCHGLTAAFDSDTPWSIHLTISLLEAPDTFASFGIFLLPERSFS